MGSKIKHEIKSLTYHEVGMKMDNALEAAEKEATKYKGGQEALVEAAKRIEELTSHADKDARDEVFDLEALKHVKRYIIRATEVVKSLALQAEVSSFIAQGKAQGCKHAVTVLKGLFDTERQALALIEAAEREIAEAAAKEGSSEGDLEEERDAPRARFPGMRPSNDIAERREAARREKEAAAKEAAAEAPAEPVSQEAIPSTSVEPTEPVEPPPAEAPKAENQAGPTSEPIPEVKAEDDLALEDFFGSAETPPLTPEPKPRRGRKKAAA